MDRSPTPPDATSDSPPDTLVILGVDASGKDHVASVVLQRLAEDGRDAQRRKGLLSAHATKATTSEGKGRLLLWRERVFLATFPMTVRLLPDVVSVLVRLDLRRFRRQADQPAVVVSYTPLRVLAFALAHGAPLPRRVDLTLRRLAAVPGVRAVVLDVSPEVRAARIAARAGAHREDHLDRYMTRPGNEALAERIESTMVELASRYLGAERIVNDDLDDEAIAAAVTAATARPTLRP